jgi:hypothetical protein
VDAIPRAVLALMFLVLAAPVCADDDGRGSDEDAQECPKGTVRVATNMREEPFKCIAEGDAALRSGPFIQMRPSFKVGPKCPKGFAAEPTPGQLSRFRCAPKVRRGGPTEPALAPSGFPDAPKLGAPARPALPKPAAGARVPTEYLRYTIKGALELDYPRGWHLEDGWSDEVPTLYVEYDTGRQGRQVTLVVSRIARGQYGYEDMDNAIAREIEYQNSIEDGSGIVGGFPARFTSLATQTRTAYVRQNENAYYTMTYTAPDDLFKSFEPAFERLLSSARFARAPRSKR